MGGFGRLKAGGVFFCAGAIMLNSSSKLISGKPPLEFPPNVTCCLFPRFDRSENSDALACPPGVPVMELVALELKVLPCDAPNWFCLENKSSILSPFKVVIRASRV